MELNELIIKVEMWCKQLNRRYEYTVGNVHRYISYSIGKKYIKVGRASDKNGLESCDAFVDFDGNIYKSASWNKPALGIRATIDNAPSEFGMLYRR